MQGSKRWLVAEQFKTGNSKRFEVIGIKLTINPCLQSLLHKIIGAGCAPSEHNAAPSEANLPINLKKLLQTVVAGATWLAPVENDSTISWSEKSPFIAVVIAECKVKENGVPSGVLPQGKVHGSCLTRASVEKLLRALSKMSQIARSAIPFWNQAFTPQKVSLWQLLSHYSLKALLAKKTIVPVVVVDANAVLGGKASQTHAWWRQF